ncbi:Golgin sub A member 2 [Coelomomyces lativittatus]|nr:Golgin sub A member 2 [Coelomomyces lativittatus]
MYLLFTEATNRYLKARLMVLEEEIDKLATEAAQAKQWKAKEQVLIKQNEVMHQKMTKQNQHLLTTNEKQAIQIQELNQKLQQSEQRIHTLLQEVQQTKKSEKIASSDSSQKDVKIVRVQDEVQKLRQRQTQIEAENKKTVEQLKLSIERLTLEIKRLEKQKAQLILGFKKQGALIDVLRKQKLHLEAIKLLSFTEEEFSKLLDWY